MQIWYLIKEFIIIGLTTFGGGSSVVPVAHQRLVERDQKIGEEEFLEIVTIANLLPGPSMIEIASGIGYRLSGIVGAIVSGISISLMPIIIFIVAMMLLAKHLNYEVLAKIILPTSIILASSMFVMSFNLAKKAKLNIFKVLVVITTVILISVFNISPIIILVVSILSIIVIYLMKRWLAKY